MNFIKYFFLSLTFLIFQVYFVFANDWVKTIYQDIEVGVEPVGILYDSSSDGFHIFCSGRDVNFNGNFEPDSGDVLPSWWFLKIDLLKNDLPYTIVKKTDLPFGSVSFHFRPAFVPEENKIYISTQNNIKAYSTILFKEISGESYKYSAQAIDYFDGKLIISESQQSNKIDSIIVYGFKTNNEICKIPGGVNLLESKIYKSDKLMTGLAVLNVGNFSSDESELFYSVFDFSNKFEHSTLNVGNTGNHLSVFKSQTLQSDFLLVTSMISGKIYIIDPNNGNFKEINTISKEWNGPSFSKIFEVESNDITKTFLASVGYNSSIEIHNLNIFKLNDSTKFEVSLIDSLKLSGKSEGFDIDSKNGKFIIVAANTLKDNYQPGNSISIILGSLPTNVNETEIGSQLMFPNPTKNYLNIEKLNLSDLFNIEINSVDGRTVYKSNSNNRFLNLELLENGIYYIKISDGIKTYVNKIIIIK